MPIRYDKRTGEPFIDPARLNSPITFLAPIASGDISGATVTWAAGNPPDIAYAELRPIRAADVIKGGQDVSKVWYTAIVRYVAPGRSPDARFQDGDGNVYVIEAAEPILPGRKVYQELICEFIGTYA